MKIDRGQFLFPFSAKLFWEQKPVSSQWRGVELCEPCHNSENSIRTLPYPECPHWGSPLIYVWRRKRKKLSCLFRTGAFFERQGDRDKERSPKVAATARAKPGGSQEPETCPVAGPRFLDQLLPGCISWELNWKRSRFLWLGLLDNKWWLYLLQHTMLAPQR